MAIAILSSDDVTRLEVSDGISDADFKFSLARKLLITF